MTAKTGDTVKVHYTGKLDDGQIFDSSEGSDPLEFTLGAGSIINIKPGRVGGLGPSLAIHDFCEANGVPVWCGGMLESGIGRAYNVALASHPNFQKRGDVSPSARYWARDVVTPELTMTPDGMVKVPLHRPGLGVTVDVGRPCGTSPGCKPIPAGVQSLVTLLQQLTKEQLGREPCRSNFPNGTTAAPSE